MSSDEIKRYWSTALPESGVGMVTLWPYEGVDTARSTVAIGKAIYLHTVEMVDGMGDGVPVYKVTYTDHYGYQDSRWEIDLSYVREDTETEIAVWEDGIGYEDWTTYSATGIRAETPDAAVRMAVNLWKEADERGEKEPSWPGAMIYVTYFDAPQPGSPEEDEGIRQALEDEDGSD